MAECFIFPYKEDVLAVFNFQLSLPQLLVVLSFSMAPFLTGNFGLLICIFPHLVAHMHE